MTYNQIKSLFSFLNCSSFGDCKLLLVGSVFFQHDLILFCVLPCWHCKVFLFILCFCPHHGPEIKTLLQRAMLPFLGKWHLETNISVCVHCCCGFIAVKSSLSIRIWRKYIVCIYSCLQISISLPICIDIESQELILILLILIHCSLVCNFFVSPGSPYLQ